MPRMNILGSSYQVETGLTSEFSVSRFSTTSMLSRALHLLRNRPRVRGGEYPSPTRVHAGTNQRCPIHRLRHKTILEYVFCLLLLSSSENVHICRYISWQEEVESPEIHFEPLVKLAPVETATLEENEEELFKMYDKVPSVCTMLYRYPSHQN